MVHRVLVLAAALGIASPALAQKVYIDYDKTVDFTQYKTFQWTDESEASLKAVNPLMHDRVVTTIRTRLTQRGGLKEVQTNPDLYVTYHASAKEEVVLNTTSMGYGYGPGWYYDPYWAAAGSTTTMSTYTRGTLIVDLWDAKTKTMVFRGSATDVLPDKPEKQEKLIDKSVNKIGDKFRGMYLEDQKAKDKAAKKAS
jgi:hypothetical protein